MPIVLNRCPTACYPSRGCAFSLSLSDSTASSLFFRFLPPILSCCAFHNFKPFNISSSIAFCRAAVSRCSASEFTALALSASDCAACASRRFSFNSFSACTFFSSAAFFSAFSLAVLSSFSFLSCSFCCFLVTFSSCLSIFFCLVTLFRLFRRSLCRVQLADALLHTAVNLLQGLSCLTSGNSGADIVEEGW